MIKVNNFFYYYLTFFCYYLKINLIKYIKVKYNRQLRFIYRDKWNKVTILMIKMTVTQFII